MSLEVWRSFTLGVLKSVPPEQLPPDASPRALDTSYEPGPSGALSLRARPGLRLAGNPGPELNGLAFYEYYSSTNSISQTFIGTGTNGKLWKIALPSSAEITIPSGTNEFASSSLSTTVGGTRFAAAGNRLFGTTGLGTPFKIWRAAGSTTLYCATNGLPTPEVPTFSTSASGPSYSMQSAYEFAITWTNSETGAESNRSEALAYDLGTSTTKNITLVLGGASGTPSTEVDAIRLHIRKPSIQSQFYYYATYSGTSTTITLDLSDNTLNGLTTKSPDTLENSRPPDNLLDLAWHQGRMFAIDGRQLYYTKLGEPESWDPDYVEVVGQHDGTGRLVGLHSWDENTLVVLKERAIYAVVGPTPQTWEIRLITSSFGCLSRRSIVELENTLFWWSGIGPARWQKGASPDLISNEVIDELVRDGTVTLSTRDDAIAGADPIGRRIVWRLESADARHQAIAFHVGAGIWEAEGWSLPEISAMATGRGSLNETRLHVAFASPVLAVAELDRLCRGDLASVTAGSNCYFAVTGGNGTTVTVTGTPATSAYFSRVRYIRASSLDVTTHTFTSTSTGGTTTLTLTPVLGFTPSTEDAVALHLPVAEYRTAISDQGNLDAQKRYLFAYAHTQSTSATETFLGIAVDGSASPIRTWRGDTSDTARLVGRCATVGEKAQLRTVIGEPTDWELFDVSLRWVPRHERR